MARKAILRKEDKASCTRIEAVSVKKQLRIGKEIGFLLLASKRPPLQLAVLIYVSHFNVLEDSLQSPLLALISQVHLGKGG